MKPIFTVVDSTSYKQRLASRLFGTDILSCAWEKGLVVLDTNILLWIYQLNKEARDEVIAWLKHLTHENRLGIPAWVVHEYNTKLPQLEVLARQPLKECLKSSSQSIDSLDSLIRMVVSNHELKGTEFTDREDLLSCWDKTVSQLTRIFRAIGNCGKSRLDDVGDEIRAIVDDAAWETDIFALVDDAQSKAPIRYAHRLAPGFKDAGKSVNSLGDYIIWREVLDHASSNNASIIFVTNDLKEDWVYAPKYVSTEKGRKIPNVGTDEPAIRLPQPYLSSEFSRVVGTEHEVCLVDSALLIHLLGSSAFNPKSYSAYQHLPNAASIGLQNSATYEVIGWFLNNPEARREAIHSVCKWDYCPSEIDHESFKKFVSSKLPDLDLSLVLWDQIIVELFI